MKHAFLAATAALALLSGCSQSAQKPADAAKQQAAAPAQSKPDQPIQHAAIGNWGVDLSEMDTSVRPGDNFFRYVNGKWLDTFQIPEDKTNYGSFTVLYDQSVKQVRGIIQDAAKANAEAGTPEQKIGDLYASFMNTEAIDAKGLDPLKPALDKIAAAKSHDDIAKIMATVKLPIDTPFGAYVDVDSKQPDAYAFYMYQSGLGLPNRDYYLEDNERFQKIRAAYKKYIAEVFTLAGVMDAGQKADAVYDLEMKMAQAHWDKKKSRNRDLTYNKMTMAQLQDYAPGFPWALANETAGVNVQDVIVRQNTAFPKLAKIFADTPVSTWADYLEFHLIDNMAGYLPKSFDDAHFEFYGKTLNGQPQQRDRWKRGVSLVNRDLGEAVGQVYVARYFPPSSKEKMEKLVNNLRAALKERIETNTWMSADTKTQAEEKLSKFTAKIGYPDKWKDYSALQISRDDLVGNVMAANTWQWDDMISKLGKPIDKTEWFMTPQTVNAYYSPNRNEIVFPAAILQPPFFDPNADPAVNYGGIGAVIGHEMGHGFDDQGAKSDGDGRLRNWWTDQDKKNFEDRTKELAAQYDQFEPVQGHHVNGGFTSGENIGDLSGVTFALEAYHMSLNGKPAPVLDGFTGDQRLFLSWAQVWRRKYREEALINRLATDPHSPSQYRTNGIVRNVDAWYKAFDVTSDEEMYLPEDKRVHIW